MGRTTIKKVHAGMDDIKGNVETIMENNQTTDQENKLDHAKILMMMDHIQDKQIKQAEDIERHERLFYGNGKDGIITVLRMVSETLNRWSKINVALLVGVIMMILELVFKFFTN